MTTSLNTLPTINEENINELMDGIQKVSRTGITQLPSRDISLDKSQQDSETVINHIPKDISEEEDEDIVMPNMSQTETNIIKSKFCDFYDELQLPLFVAVLFFVFQLPATKQNIQFVFPSLFLEDDNYNIYGFIFMSILYSLCFYIMCKFIHSG